MVSCIQGEHVWFVFFQAEDGIRDLVRSRGLGDVYKRQTGNRSHCELPVRDVRRHINGRLAGLEDGPGLRCLSLIHI